jgi:hypothetical protein
MKIRLIETMPKDMVELTYRCERCEFDSKVRIR